MKTAVMGAGAVGCYYGGMLARAGHEVILIGRQQHVEAVRRDGLFLDTKAFQAHVPMQADTAVSAMQGAKLVLCCVKSTDTESAAAAAVPAATKPRRDTPVALCSAVEAGGMMDAEPLERVAMSPSL